MNADDMQPNRLEVAKQTIKSLLDQFQGDQIGLVLFAGKPFVSIPLSFDLDAIKQMITQYSTETINQQNPALQGTAIGDAILASLSLLENQ
jgi:Ca-activated chloride channel homolog